MAYDEELADRSRAALSGDPSVREVRMFGGLVFMVNEKLALGAHRGGELLLRVAPEAVDALLGRGAAVAEMGRGRRMSGGWLTVGPQLVDSEADLRYWVDAALEHNRAITGRR